MDDNPQEIPQANCQPGMSSKKILAIIIVAVALTALAVWWYMLPSGPAITSPEEAANTSVDVARTAADLGSSLDSIQEALSPS